MPFIPYTPESLVRRSDSKDPATTCKGITTGGRHCRRDIALPQTSPGSRKTSQKGVVAILPANKNDTDGAAAYFCWQHKDQAKDLVSSEHNERKANLVPVQQRTSIDTLAERLGLVNIRDDHSVKQTRRRHVKTAKKETLPKKWRDMDGPLLAVPNREVGLSKENKLREPARVRKAGSSMSVSVFCCVRPADSDSMPPSRPVYYAERPSGAKVFTPNRVRSRRSPANGQAQQGRPERPQPLSTNPKPTSSDPQLIASASGRPVLGRDRSSHTQTLLSLMPGSLSPQITSSLLTELAKPISPLDEAGYIYMFWLTDTPEAPDTDTASSLLGDVRHASSARRQSDVLQRYTSVRRSSGTGSTSSTILLKIGRAANVQRRMNQWTRQCGYNLSLIRYYPYRPSSPSAANMSLSPVSSSSPAQVPHAHKIERLIHLELAEMRIKRNCESCGKEHREWFEVEGSRGGLKNVDEVIRRWVTWGQKTPKP